jgi:16S rRNA (guanine527-N7)-methyltransferase
MSRPRRGQPPLQAEGFAARLGQPVSRETLDRLEAYLERLRHWSGAINLVGASTLSDPWRRHLLDSAQLLRFFPANARILVDLGSGAGLPGLVLAIMGVPEAHLIESDRRKAAFLRDTAARLGLRVTVHAERIEALEGFPADVVTARALAPLPKLLAYAARFVGPKTRLVFPEGRAPEADLEAARRDWRLRAESFPSLSDPEGRILVIEDLRPGV